MGYGSFYFNQEATGEYTKAANIESPSFIGTPTVPTPKKINTTQITNVEFIKEYINAKLHKFGFHTVHDTSNTLTLHPNKEYFVNVSGIIDMVASSSTVKMGYVAICDSDGNVLEKSDTLTESSMTPTGGITQSATLVLRTPLDGKIFGYINYEGTLGKIPANYMCAVEVDRDEYCNIYLNQKPHEVMYLTANDETYSDTEFMLSKNSVYNIEVICDIGYKNGEITPGSSGTIDGDTTFDIETAVYSPCNITINQTPNQTIIVTNDGADKTTSFTGRYNSTFTVQVVPDSDTYIAGTPNVSEGTITDSMTITATNAQTIYRKIYITQSSNQVITLTRLDTGAKTTTMFTVPHNTPIRAEIKADKGWLTGEMNVNEYFNATEDLTVYATEATKA